MAVNKLGGPQQIVHELFMAHGVNFSHLKGGQRMCVRRDRRPCLLVRSLARLALPGLSALSALLFSFCLLSFFFFFFFGLGLSASVPGA